MKKQQPFVPVVKHLKSKVARDNREFEGLIEQIGTDACGFGTTTMSGYEEWTDDGRLMFQIDDLKRALSDWSLEWRGSPRKTEVFYLLLPFPAPHTLNVVNIITYDFVDRAFTPGALFDQRDVVYSLKRNDGGIDVHMLINRSNGDDLMAFNYQTERSYTGLCDLLAKSHAEYANHIDVTVDTNDFTMGFRQALNAGIDYRDYVKIDCLPAGAKLTAIAGVWGDRQNLRCLFEDDQGHRWMRVVFAQGNYFIPELGLSGTALRHKALVNVMTQ